MNLAQVYSTPPIFPRFVAIDTDFAGTNIVYDGIKNPSLNLQDREHEIIEGINVVRGRFQIFTIPVGNIPAQNLGNFWVYATAPYPEPIFMNGLEGYLLSPSNNYQNLSDWDVYNHYVSTNSYQLLTPIQTSSNPIASLFNGQDIRTSIDNYPDNYYAGKWNWDWSWSYGSSFDGVNDNYINDFQMKTFPTVVSIGRANYIDLLRGYPADNRSVIQQPVIIPSISETIEVSYYRENKMESVPDLQSIDWMFYDCQLEQGVPYTLPITDCCLGTLHLSSQSVKSQITNTVASSNYYDLKYFLNENLPDLFAEWNQGQAATNNILRVIGANNNHWNNRPIPTSYLNFDIIHPMFAIDNQRAYNWHIKPQTNGSYGDLVMDSPRIIELHNALNAASYQTEADLLHKLDYYIKLTPPATNPKIDEIHTALNAAQYLSETAAVVGTGTINNPQTPATHKLDWYIKHSSIPTAITDKITAIWKALGGNKYATNMIEVTRDKITNLGWFIENIARVNGLRFNDDGDIDLVQERDLYRPKTIENPSLGLPSADGKYNDYSMSCYGKIGMIVPHLPTTYKVDGKAVELFDVVHDNQQLVIAILRQLDVALSIQHGSEIRFKGLDGKVQAYPNQLAVSLASLQLIEKIGYQTDKNLIVSTVAGTEIRELFSGIGIPVTQKSLLLTNPKNSKAEFSVPYFGHQKNKPSTAQLINTALINIAVINGVLMPKKQPQASITNPFKRFTAKDK